MVEKHTKTLTWNFDNTYARLSEKLFATHKPTPVKEPRLILFNHALAENLGINAQDIEANTLAAIFSGNVIPEGAFPIAQAYAGHQFGHFTMLGDGRALLLGEHLSKENSRYDIQLKGSGQTCYSRRGDGRAALGPMLREYLISEAMHALRIPTTRSLAVVSTGELVYRESPLPGAVLTRVAASHIRVGTFEYAAACGDKEVLKQLTNYTIARHYPLLAEAENPAVALLKQVIERQAHLIARWLLVGFIHGVMNTDNMAISGETIDYGPCAFMDYYDPETVFSSIDHLGRYAYHNQPHMAQWNLARFAESLLPLLHAEQTSAVALAEEAIADFSKIFKNAWLSGMRSKLGLFNHEPDDIELIETLLLWMQQSKADYTNTFRLLSNEQFLTKEDTGDAALSEWLNIWRFRRNRQSESLEESVELMRSNNPLVIPRNHRVEEALTAAVENNDLTLITTLMSVLSDPFSEKLASLEYTKPALINAPHYKTFCGT